MRRLEVWLDWGDAERVVGTLAELDRRLYFEYDGGFIADPLPISPFHLPVQPGVLEESERVFEGLPGVFNDSLPDGWGLLLMDRNFRSRGVPREQITALHRLAYIHTRAMGALTYHPAGDAPHEG